MDKKDQARISCQLFLSYVFVKNQSCLIEGNLFSVLVIGNVEKSKLLLDKQTKPAAFCLQIKICTKKQIYVLVHILSGKLTNYPGKSLVYLLCEVFSWPKINT